MGGKATYKKRFDGAYYYHGCNECKNNIKEEYIEGLNLSKEKDDFEH